jgi:uncharacterized protein
MRKLALVAVIGLAAQLVDGALGMAYGATSTSLLLSAGLAPAIVSATVHLAEIGTTAASGAAHWRFRNVDWRTVSILAVPGAIGGFLGAVVLSSLSAESAEPVMAAVLVVLGLYVLLRFSVLGSPAAGREGGRPLPRIFLGPLGAFAGFMDAAGGGGWGPISTPALLSTGRMEPRKVIGSVDTSEFAVAVGASAGFLVGLGSERIDFGFAGALLVGGLIAAPIAAYLVKLLPPRMLGAAVGGLIVLTNGRTLGEAVGLSGEQIAVLTAIVAVLWAAAVAVALAAVRREPSPEPA